MTLLLWNIIGFDMYFVLSFRLGSFMGIANSFDQYPREWHQWFTSDSPETTHLPG